MLKIYNKDNSLIVEGLDNGLYPDNGQNSYPLNSLIIVTDDSDIVTFRSAATNDVLFSGVIENITINGEAVTKDNIIAKFDAVSNVEAGGGSGGGMTDEEREELKNLRGDVENALGDISALEIDKQDKLKSGENIKTVNGESILGEGNIEIQGGDEHFEYVGDRDLMSDKGQGVFIVDSYKSYIPGHDIQGIRVVQSESQVEPIQNSDYLYEIDPYIVGATLFANGSNGQVNIATVYADRIVFNANVWQLDNEQMYEVAYYVNGIKVKDSNSEVLNFTLNIGDSFVAVDEQYGWRNGFDNVMSSTSMLSAIKFRGTETTASLNANQQLIYKDKNKTQHNVALQDQLKTINGTSIVGTGNITISAQDAVKNINGKTPTTAGTVTLYLSDIDKNVADNYKVSQSANPSISNADNVNIHKYKNVEDYVELNVGIDAFAFTQAFLCLKEYDENQWTEFDCNTYATLYDFNNYAIAEVYQNTIKLNSSSIYENDKVYYSEIWEDGVKIKDSKNGDSVTLYSGKKYVFVNLNNYGSSLFSDIDPMNGQNWVVMNYIRMNTWTTQTVKTTYKDAFKYDYQGKSYNILNEGNVKTINGETIYGDGNIEIESVDAYTKQETEDRLENVRMDIEERVRMELENVPGTIRVINYYAREGNFSEEWYTSTSGKYEYKEAVVFPVSEEHASDLYNHYYDVDTPYLLRLTTQDKNIIYVLMDTYDKEIWDEISQDIVGNFAIGSYFKGKLIEEGRPCWFAVRAESSFARFYKIREKVENGGGLTPEQEEKLNSLSPLPAGNYLAKFEQNGGQIDFTQRGFDGKSEETKSITLKTVNSQSLFGMGDIQVDVPTPQVGASGTNKNYVYSLGTNTIKDMNKNVIGDIRLVQNTDSIELSKITWGSSSSFPLVIPSASSEKAGVMTAADKIKLDSLSEGGSAEPNIWKINRLFSEINTSYLDGEKRFSLDFNFIGDVKPKDIKLGDIIEDGSGYQVVLTSSPNHIHTEDNNKLVGCYIAFGYKCYVYLQWSNSETFWMTRMFSDSVIKTTDDYFDTSNSKFCNITPNAYNELAKKSELPQEWTGTLSQYQALGTYDDNTTYYIVEE